MLQREDTQSTNNFPQQHIISVNFFSSHFAIKSPSCRLCLISLISLWAPERPRALEHTVTTNGNYGNEPFVEVASAWTSLKPAQAKPSILCRESNLTLEAGAEFKVSLAYLPLQKSLLTTAVTNSVWTRNLVMDRMPTSKLDSRPSWKGVDAGAKHGVQSCWPGHALGTWGSSPWVEPHPEWAGANWCWVD